MCCPSMFTCTMAMISSFLIISAFRGIFFLRFFFHKYNILLPLDVISILLLLTVTFFSFQNHLYFLCVLLKKYKSFSCNLFHDIKYVCFLCDQMSTLLTLNIHNKYALQFFLLKKCLDYLLIHQFFN